MKKTLNILFIISLYFMASSSVFAQSFYELVKDNSFPTNRTANELAPTVVRNGVVFCSDKPTGGIIQVKDKNGGSFSNLYFTELLNDVEWGPAKDFALELSTKTHIGPISFNSDEDMAVFSRNYSSFSGFGNDRNVNPNAGLFFAKYNGSKWTDTVEFEHNNHDFFYTHPSLSSTGDTLYFASNDSTLENWGRSDIYVSYRKDGKWSKPKNLGPVVNTEADEKYPFLHSSGRLYFSSNGHKGIGGYDIFYSDFYEGKWFSPIDVSRPINSAYDDFTFYADAKYEKVLVTSNYDRERRKQTNYMSIYEYKSKYSTTDGVDVKLQVENNYCYIFFEENTVSLDTFLYVYEWNMGDGTKIKAMEAEHCFKGPGDYFIELNVIDKLTGKVEFNQSEYLVEVRKVIQPYISCPDTGFVNEKIFFNGSESYLGDVEPGDFVWDFGGGNKSPVELASHTYKTPGEKRVRLLIIEKGKVSTARNRNKDKVEENKLEKFGSYKTIYIRERE